jgi:hypothetical protein
VNAERFVRHINENRCPKCTAVVRYLEQQSRLDLFLRNGKN